MTLSKYLVDTEDGDAYELAECSDGSACVVDFAEDLRGPYVDLTMVGSSAWTPETEDNTAVEAGLSDEDDRLWQEAKNLFGGLSGTANLIGDSEAIKEGVLLDLKDLSEQDPQELMREALRVESGQDSPAADLGADEPSDDEMFSIFDAAHKGELATPEREAVDLSDDEPTDDEFWKALPESFKRGEGA
jgi:hypothetical protein